MSKATSKEKQIAKKASEKAFQDRIERNLIELCRSNNINNIVASPFSLWLKAYDLALQIKFTIYEDEEYIILKDAINKGHVDKLSDSLKQIVRRNNLYVRRVPILDPRSLSTRTNAYQSSTSKELISLQVEKLHAVKKDNRKIDVRSESDDEDDDADDEQKQSDQHSNTNTLNGANFLDIPFRIVVPLGKIEQVIKKIHISNDSGKTVKDIHLSVTKTVKLINDYFDGVPRLAIKEYIKRCSVCQSKSRLKERQIRAQRFLQPIQEGGLFERMELDLFFMKSYKEKEKRNMNIVVAQLVDHKSKLRFAKVIPNKEPQHVVEFLHSIYSITGPPLILQTDNGSEFVNEQMFALNSLWEVQHINSSPYHPQTNGVVENANGSLKDAIRKWQAANPNEDWTYYLNTIVHQLNITNHATLGMSPFKYVFGIRSWKERKLINKIMMANSESKESDEEDNSGDQKFDSDALDDTPA